MTKYVHTNWYIYTVYTHIFICYKIIKNNHNCRKSIFWSIMQRYNFSHRIRRIIFQITFLPSGRKWAYEIAILCALVCVCVCVCVWACECAWVSVCIFSFQLLNQQTELNETWYKHYVVRGHPNVVSYSFLKRVTKTWRARELVSCDDFSVTWLGYWINT
jgi:hypothetical protein